mgnify:CR=1 FL=1
MHVIGGNVATWRSRDWRRTWSGYRDRHTHTGTNTLVRQRDATTEPDSTIHTRYLGTIHQIGVHRQQMLEERYTGGLRHDVGVIIQEASEDEGVSE